MVTKMLTYQNLHNGLKSLVRVFKGPSIYAPGEVRSREDIKRQIREVLDPTREVVHKELEVTRDVIIQYIVENAKLYTKFTMLLNWFQTKSNTLLLNALECKVRYHWELSQKVKDVVVE